MIHLFAKNLKSKTTAAPVLGFGNLICTTMIKHLKENFQHQIKLSSAKMFGSLLVGLFVILGELQAQRTPTDDGDFVFSATQAHRIVSARLSDETFITAYKTTNSTASDILAVVGTYSGGTISGYGTIATVETAATPTDNSLAIVGLTATKAVILYSENGVTTLKYRVLDIDISTGAITVNSAADLGDGEDLEWFESLNATALSSTQIVATYERNPADLVAVAGTVSGSTITWGTTVVVDAGENNYTSITRMDASKFAMVYEDDDAATDAGNIVAGTVSGNTITMGTPQVFEGTDEVSVVAITALSDTEVVVAYENFTNGDAEIFYSTLSGTVFSFPGTNSNFESATSVQDIYMGALSSTEVFLTTHSIVGPQGAFYVGLLSGNNITLSSASGTTYLSGGNADFARVVPLNSDVVVVPYNDEDNVNTNGADFGATQLFEFSSTTNPEINVQGNATSIISGDITPSAGDHTDFGTGAMLSRTFTIQNQGTGTLTLGASAVTITGTNAADFSVNTQPATTVAGSGSTTFIIDFASGVASTRSAEIHINSDDLHEYDYTFSIQAVGVVPAVAPSITTDAASSLASTAATLNGNITSDGGASITARGFVYALTSVDATPTLGEQNGSTIIQVVEGGTATGTFLSAIASLTASSNYSYISYATNSAGTTEGSVQTFNTTAPLPIVKINEVVTDPQQDWSGGSFANPSGVTSVNDGTDEWIELYIGTVGIDFEAGSDWTIEVYNDDGSTLRFSGTLTGGLAFDVVNYITSGSGTINSSEVGDYIILGDPDGSNTMINAVDIVLKNESGVIIDQVDLGSGTASGNASAVSDESIQRLPNATDTDTDASDFGQGYATLGFSNSTPFIANASWSDQTADGNLDRVVLTFSQNVDITDGSTGDGFGAILIDNSGAVTIDNANYANTNQSILTLNFTSGNQISGTDFSGITVTYSSAGANSIVATTGAIEIPDGNITALNGTNTDVAIPVISSVAVSSDNTYADVTFSEGVYNTNGGSGALEIADFVPGLTSGTAITPVISSITQNDGSSALVGGETIIRVFFSYTNTADGSEVLDFDLFNATSVFDLAGNAAVADQVTTNTDNLQDNTLPTISSVVVATDNSYSDITFSEAVYNATGGSGALESGDFALSLSGGTATAPVPGAITQTGGGALVGGETTVRLAFTYTGIADGAEVLEVDIADGASIFDAADNAAVADQITTNTDNLIEKILPIINNVVVASDNTYADITFSEPVYNAIGATGALQANDFDLSLTGGTANTPVAGAITQTGGGALVGGETTVRLAFTYTGTADGAEVLDVDLADGTSVFDAADNAAVADQVTNNTDNLQDNTLPTITSVVVASDNATMDITFSEAVYNATGMTGALQANDFALSLTGGTANTPVAGAITTVGGAGLVGGETTVRLAFTYTGTADGAEVLEVDIADGASIFDAADNAAVADQVTTNTDNLQDDTPPDLTSVERQSPSTSPTNADALIWRFTFTEAVSNLDGTDFSVGNTTATVTLVDDQTGGVYDITVSGGDLAGLNATPDITLSISDITDAAGNALSSGTPTGTNDNTFVVDNIFPTLDDIDLDDTDHDGLIDQIIFTFSENIDTDNSATPVIGDLGTLTLPDGATIVTSAGLGITDPAGGTTTVTISGISDQVDVNTAIGSADMVMSSGLWVDNAGNELQAITTGTTTFTDHADPILVSSTPPDESASFDPADDIVLTFSEDVQANSGNITIEDLTNGTDDRTIAIGSTTILNNTVTIDPGANLASPNNYAVQIVAAAIQDASTANNSYAGIGNSTDLNFTADVTAPPACSHDYITAGGATSDSDGHLSESFCNSEPSTISTLSDTQLEAVSVFYFNITSGNDRKETFSEVVFQNGNTNIDWSNAIAGAQLINEFGSDQVVLSGANITANTITFGSITNSDVGDLGWVSGDGTGNNSRDASDGNAPNGVEYALRIWFNQDLGVDATTIDGENLVFNVSLGDFTEDKVESIIDDSDGEWSSSTSVEITSGASNNEVTVVATHYNFGVSGAIPTTTEQNSIMSAVQLQATDINGNRDLDYGITETVTITSTGTVNPAPTVTSFTAGLGTVSDIIHIAGGSMETLGTSGGALDNSYDSDNAQLPNSGALATTFNIDPDNTPPTVTSVTPNITGTISDSDVGAGNFTVAVLFNESLDAVTHPSLALTPDVSSGGTGSIIFTGGAWSTNINTNDTYTATYTVADVNETVSLVDIGVNGAVDAAGPTTQTVASNNTDEFSIDTENPAAFTVGTVTTQGAPVVSGYWNLDNTSIDVVVPVANDASLTGGTIQVRADVASGGFENLGATHTILVGELGTNVTLNFSAATFEALSGTLAEGESIVFDAIIVDTHGNATTGASSSQTIVVDRVGPIVNDMDIYDTNNDGFVDQIIITFNENVDTDNGAPPVFADLGTLLLPDGSTLTTSAGVGITDPAGTGTTVTISNIAIADHATNVGVTADGSTSIDALTGLWRDNAGNLLIATGDDSETVTDSAAPVIASTSTLDTDFDGQIDGMIVTLTENIVDASSTIDATTFDVLSSFVGEATVTGTGNDNVLILSFTESGTPDSDTSPNIDLNIGKLSDGTTTSVATQNFTGTTDGAGPAAISTLTLDTDGDGIIDRMEIEFSEAVTDAGFNAAALADWTLDEGNGAESFTGFDTEVTDLAAVNIANDKYVALLINTGLAINTQVLSYAYTNDGGDDINDALTNKIGDRGTTASTDGAGAIIVNSISLDNNGDGNTETIELEMSETISDFTFLLAIADWSVSSDNFSAGAPNEDDVITTLSTEVSNLTAANVIDDQYVTISWTPTNTIGTGIYHIQYTNSGKNIIDKSARANVISTFPSSYAATDGAFPIFHSVVTNDDDDNGQIDQIIVRFSDVIDVLGGAQTLDIAPAGGVTTNFTVTGYSITAVTPVAGAGLDDDEIILTVAELSSPDTDATPNVTYNNNTLVDNGGALIAGNTIAASDEALPIYLSATTKDTDNNGQIDRIVVLFSEPVDATTIDEISAGGFDDFSVAGYTITAVTPVAGTGVNDNDINLTITESGSNDTGAVPNVTVNASQINDLAGHTLSTDVLAAIDGVTPVIISAVWEDDNNNGNIDQVVLTFSEPVDIIDAHAMNAATDGFDGILINDGGAVTLDGFDYSATNTTTMTITFLGDEITGNGIAGVSATYDDGSTDMLIDETGTSNNEVADGIAALGNTDNATPLTTSVSLITNNGTDNQHGRDGDVVTLAFSLDDDLTTDPTVTFSSGGTTVQGIVTVNNGSAPSYTATYTVDGTGTSPGADRDVDGALTFTIDFTDDGGNAGTQVTTVTDGSSIEIDTNVPILSSIGLTTDNGTNNQHGKDGDVVTLTFTSDDVLSATPVVTFSSGGTAVQGAVTVNTASAPAYTATYTVDGTGSTPGTDRDVDGALTFTINFVDDAGHVGTQVTSVTDGSSIEIDTNVPVLSSIGLTTNNGTNNQHGKDGDVVTLTFTSDDVLSATPVVTFSSGGTAVQGAVTVNTASAPSYTATYTVDGTGSTPGTDRDVDGALTFTINFVDDAGHVGTQVTSVTDGSSIEIDTNVPVLSSIGLTTNNGTNNQHGKDGDVVTLTFTSDDVLSATPVVTFSSGGTAVQGAVTVNTASAPAYTATYTVDGTGTSPGADRDVDGALTFTIDFTDDGGNAGTQVTTVTDGSSIEIDTNVPILSSIGLTTDNGTNNQHGKDGDVVTLTFTSDDVLSATPVVTFSSGGTAVQGAVTVNTASAPSYTATYTVDGTGTSPGADRDVDGALTFTINFVDDAGHVGTQVTSVTDGSSIEIDTNVPILSSIGLTTDNGTNNQHGKDGDVVTLTFTSDDVLSATPVVTFSSGGTVVQGAVTVNTASAPSYTATYTVDGTGSTPGTDRDVDGALTFTIDFVDDAGHIGTQVTSVTDGSSIEIDTNVPVLSSIGLTTNNGTNNQHGKDGDVVTLTFTSDDVLSATPVVTFSSGGTAVQGAVTVNTASAPAYTATYTVDGTGTSPGADRDVDGALTFTINFVDDAGHVGTQVTSVTDGSSIEIDTNVPILSSIGLTTNNGTNNQHGKDGDVVTLTFTSDDVLSATPVVTFSSGGTAVQGAVTVNTASAPSYTATYTVDGTGTSPGADRDVDGALTFTIDFVDDAGHVGTQVTSVTDGSSIEIDTNVPVLSSIGLTTNNGTNNQHGKDGDVVTLTFTSDDVLSATPVVTFSSGGTAVQGAVTVNTASAPAYSATYTVDGTGSTPGTDRDVDGALTFTIDFVDDAGHAGTQVTSVTDGSSIEIDNAVPTTSNVTIISNNGTNTDRAVTGNTVTLSFTVNDDLTNNPTVSFKSGGAVVNGGVSIGGSNPNYTASYVVAGTDADGGITFTIDFTDDAGNAATQVTTVSGTGSATSVTVDNTAPTVTITRDAVTNGSFTSTNDNSVSYSIVFSEDIDNNASEFTIATDVTESSTGLTTTAGLTEEIATSDYTLDFSGITGDGNLSFTLLHNGTTPITDLAGNPMSGSVVSDVITIDNSPPTITAAATAIDNGISIDVSLTEVGTAYYVIVPNGSTAPSSAEVLAQTDYSVTLENNGTLNITSTGVTFSDEVTLSSNTATFDLYVVSEDALLNLSTVTSQLNVSSKPDGASFTEISTDVANGDSNGDNIALYLDSNSNVTTGSTPVTINPTVVTNTIRIYTDDALTTQVSGSGTVGSFSPTLANLDLTTASYGVNTFYITETSTASSNGIESDYSTYSVAIINPTNTTGFTSFPDDNVTGTTIQLPHPTGHTIDFNGDGISNNTFNVGGTSSVKFVPVAAGTGTHVLSVDISNDNTGIEGSFEFTFTVVASESILDNANQTVNFRKSDGAQALQLNDAPSTYDINNSDTGLDDYYSIEAYLLNPVSAITGQTTGVDSGTDNEFGSLVLSYNNTNGLGIVANTPTYVADGEWTFDPSAFESNFSSTNEVDTLKLISILSQESDGSLYAKDEVEIYLFPDPTVAVVGVNDFYCEDDGSFNIQASIYTYKGSGGVDSTGNIVNGYKLFESNDNGSTYDGYPNTPLSDFTSSGTLTNTFDPSSLGVGYYRILYTSDAQTDAGTIGTATYDVQILSKPDQPTLDETGFGSIGTINSGDYLFEYCGGETILDLTAIVDGGNSQEEFVWYTSISGGLGVNQADASNISGTKNETIDILDELFLGVTPTARQTRTIYFTKKDHVGLTGTNTTSFEGCESELTTITIEVYPNPAQVTVDVTTFTSSTTNQTNLGAKSVSETGVASIGYTYEYCGTAASTISLENIITTSGLSTESNSESYFTLYDSLKNEVTTFTVASLSEDSIKTHLSYDPKAEADDESLIVFYISRTDFDNNFPTSISAPFSGCEGDLTQFTIDVNSIPDAPDTTAFTSQRTEYYLCNGDDLDNIETPGLTGSAYTWYEDNGTGTAASANVITVAAFNDRFITQSEFENANTGVAGFSNVNTGTSPITYTYWVTQTRGINESTGFDGCESDHSKVTITVYPDPAAPTFTLDGDASDIDTSADLELNFCEGDLGSLSVEVNGNSNAIFNWYQSADGTTISNTTAVFTGSTATGVDLRITAALEADPTLYFLVAQVNDTVKVGSTEIFTGCQTEVTDMALLTVNVFDIPSGHQEENGITDFYYCFDASSNVVDITVNGEGNTGDIFYWYATQADAEAGTNRLTTADATGKTITPSELIPSETDEDGNTVTNMGTSPGVGEYSFFVNETTDINTGAFVGCESVPLQININIQEVPADINLISDNVAICFGAANPTFQATNNVAGSQVNWYDTDGTTVLSQGVSNQFLPTTAQASGAATYSWFVSQTTDINIASSGFGGCESTTKTPITFTINAIPAPPAVNGGTNAYTYCSDETIATLDVDTNTGQTYKWYTNVATTDVINTAASTDGSVIEATDHSSFPDPIVSTTSGTTTYYVTTIENNCESSLNTDPTLRSAEVTILINPLPVLSVASTLEDAYCIDGVVEKIVMTNQNDDIDNGISSVFSGTGLLGKTNNAEDSVDLYTAAGEAQNSKFLGGNFAYSFSYTHTDANGCTATVNPSFEINGLPRLSFSGDIGGGEKIGNTLPVIIGGSQFLTNTRFLNNSDIEICDEETAFNISGQNGGSFSLIDASNNVTNLAVSEDFTNFSPSAHNQTSLNQASETFRLVHEYTDANGCFNSVENNITIHRKPEVSIDFNDGCAGQALLMHADTIPNGAFAESVLSYNWDFGDQEVETDQGTGQDTLYNYSLGEGVLERTFTTSLYATTQFGCVSDLVEKDVAITVSPHATFRWDSVVVGRPTYFTPAEILLSASVIDSITFDFGDGTVLGFVTNNVGVDGFGTDKIFTEFVHTYENAGLYNVNMEVETSNGCIDQLSRNVNVVPLVTQLPYEIDFDGFDAVTINDAGWYAETLRPNALQDSTVLEQSWWFGTAKGGHFDISNSQLGSTLSGNNYWSTTNNDTNVNTNGYLREEKSWIYTPAFDISSMTRPMLTFNSAFSFEDNKDGVAVQYSTDNGNSWKVLGDFDSDVENSATGLEWYNGDNVQGDPGNQTAPNNDDSPNSVGWTNTVATPTWVNSRHKLDGIGIGEAEEKLVRFRFAIGVQGTNPGQPGFAFDDFKIVEREKNVLLEMFSSTESVPSGTVSGLIANRLDDVSINNGDVFTINYHTALYNTASTSDPINVLNTADPSARVSYYGVSKITSFLDGNPNTSSNLAEDVIPWSENNLSTSSLESPAFEITFGPGDVGGAEKIDVDVTFTSLENFGVGTSFLLHTAIIEKLVTGINATNGQVESRNVLRKMLKNGAGQLVELGTQLNAGTVLTFVDRNGVTQNALNAAWTIKNVQDPNNLAVVAFIQNKNSKEIYQSNTLDITGKSALVTSIDDVISSSAELKMKLYPNPADNHVTIVYPEKSTEDLDWAVFDQSGRIYERGNTTNGFEGFELDTNDFPNGIYYISVQGESTQFKTKKLMVIH